jgi:hypothetical protein
MPVCSVSTAIEKTSSTLPISLHEQQQDHGERPVGLLHLFLVVRITQIHMLKGLLSPLTQFTAL